MEARDAAPAPVAAPPKAVSRRARKKAGTRRDIYRAAMKLFRERGFDGVTVEAICDEADVARRTFFLHFPTKAALLYEFNRQVTEDFCARLPEPRGSALAELEILVDMVGERLRADAPVMRAMLREYFTTPLDLIGTAQDEDDLPRLLVDIIRRGQQRGELRKTIAPELAVGVFLSTSSVILSGRALPPETTAAEARRQFFEVVLSGIQDDETRRQSSNG